MFEGDPIRRFDSIEAKPPLYWIHVLTAYGVLIFLVGFLGTNVTPTIDVNANWYRVLSDLIPGIEGRAVHYAYPDHARFTLVLAWLLMPIAGVTSGVLHGLSSFRLKIRNNKDRIVIFLIPFLTLFCTVTAMNLSHSTTRIGSVGFLLKVWNSGPFGFGSISALVLWAVALSWAMVIALTFFMFRRYRSQN